MSRSVTFTPHAWGEYLSWQKDDRKTLRKLNSLIEDVRRNGNEGIGKPEPLTDDLAGFWSRRINEKDRLVYMVTDKSAHVISCRSHYGDK